MWCWCWTSPSRYIKLQSPSFKEHYFYVVLWHISSGIAKVIQLWRDKCYNENFSKRTVSSINFINFFFSRANPAYKWTILNTFTSWIFSLLASLKRCRPNYYRRPLNDNRIFHNDFSTKGKLATAPYATDDGFYRKQLLIPNVLFVLRYWAETAVEVTMTTAINTDTFVTLNLVLVTSQILSTSAKILEADLKLQVNISIANTSDFTAELIMKSNTI